MSASADGFRAFARQLFNSDAPGPDPDDDPMRDFTRRLFHDPETSQTNQKDND